MRLLRNPERDHGTASCFSYDGNWHQNEILREVAQQMSVNCLSDVPQIAVPVQPCSFTENGFYSNYTVCDSERKVQLCTGTKGAVFAFIAGPWIKAVKLRLQSESMGVSIIDGGTFAGAKAHRKHNRRALRYHRRTRVSDRLDSGYPQRLHRFQVC